MVGREENPFRLGFVVDADVQTRGGKPALYVIRRIHGVVDLGDTETQDGARRAGPDRRAADEPREGDADT